MNVKHLGFSLLDWADKRLHPKHLQDFIYEWQYIRKAILLAAHIAKQELLFVKRIDEAIESNNSYVIKLELERWPDVRITIEQAIGGIRTYLPRRYCRTPWVDITSPKTEYSSVLRL